MAHEADFATPESRNAAKENPRNKGSGENTIENGTFSVLSPAAFWFLCRREQRNTPAGRTLLFSLWPTAISVDNYVVNSPAGEHLSTRPKIFKNPVHFALQTGKSMIY